MFTNPPHLPLSRAPADHRHPAENQPPPALCSTTPTSPPSSVPRSHPQASSGLPSHPGFSHHHFRTITPRHLPSPHPQPPLGYLRSQLRLHAIAGVGILPQDPLWSPLSSPIGSPKVKPPSYEPPPARSERPPATTSLRSDPTSPPNRLATARVPPRRPHPRPRPPPRDCNVILHSTTTTTVLRRLRTVHHHTATIITGSTILGFSVPSRFSPCNHRLRLASARAAYGRAEFSPTLSMHDMKIPLSLRTYLKARAGSQNSHLHDLRMCPFQLLTGEKYSLLHGF